MTTSPVAGAGLASDAGNGAEPEPVLFDPDPAASSAASDPAPGAPRRRGRPAGSKNKAPQTDAQRKASMANLRRGTTTRTGPTDRQLEDSLAMLYASLGVGVALVADQDIGQAVASCGPAAAAAWVHLAQQNPAIRRVLVSMTTASATSELLMAHAPLFALVAGRARPGMVAPPPPAPSPPPSAGDHGANGAGPEWVPAPGYVG